MQELDFTTVIEAQAAVSSAFAKKSIGDEDILGLIRYVHFVYSTRILLLERKKGAVVKDVHGPILFANC